ncbi:MAG: yagH, partial [Proteobacteria bacterium]|nr:yagH [Pseudomonadota bacterium]
LPDGPVHLRVEVDEERLYFAFSLDGETWTFIDRVFDASILSDEAAAPGTPNFTGAFVGMACQDMSGDRLAADFDFFDYRERDYRVDPRR